MVVDGRLRLMLDFGLILFGAAWLGFVQKFLWYFVSSGFFLRISSLPILNFLRFSFRSRILVVGCKSKSKPKKNIVKSFRNCNELTLSNELEQKLERKVQMFLGMFKLPHVLD
jgi:hypothetical protein